jgi:hypothetical protein
MKSTERVRCFTALAVLLFLAVLAPAGVAAQERCDEAAGTLGIQGMRCEGCTFRMSRSGIEDARFRTEPEVLAVARGFTTGDELRPGDRIVALDGRLITTREGGNALARIRAGQRIELRVRRDGRLEDLELVAGSACALRRAVDEREIEVDRVAPLPPGFDMVELPPLPDAPGAADAPTARTPRATDAPPSPGAPRPSRSPWRVLPSPPSAPRTLTGENLRVTPPGYLGFGFSCARCGIRDGEFFFSGPIVVEGLAAAGPAARAGLESGDSIVALDGTPMAEEAAGDRFGDVQPGDTVRLTVRRGGQDRGVTLVAGERLATTAPPPPTLRVEDRVRFDGKLGDVEIEVRGAPVRVTRDEGTGELVIRTRDTVVRLRKGGS